MNHKQWLDNEYQQWQEIKQSIINNEGIYISLSIWLNKNGDVEFTYQKR